MKWMKHDSNANADAKLRKLRSKYGMEGYGLYWLCLEYVAANVEKHNLTFELEHDSELLSIDTGIHHELVQEMMAYMCNLELFENDRGVITCLKMATRTDEYTQKLMKSSGVVPTLSGESPRKSVLIEENRREEKRKTKRFSPPSLKEVTDYCDERKNTVNPQMFIDHYETNGWFRGKTKIKDWKACVRTWEKKEDVDNGFSGAI